MKLVSASWLLALNHIDLLPNGAMAVDGDTIAAVGPLSELQHQYPSAAHEHFEDTVLMPGLVNAHCHLDRCGFFERYTVETETNFSPVTWLLEGLNYLSRTPATTVAARIQRELDSMLERGITCVGAMTHYEGTYPLAAAHPIRGVIFQEILSGPDKRAQQRFEVALALIEQYAEAKPNHLRMGLGPYSAYLLSKNLLNIISRHAKDKRIPLQIHVAEHFAEMEFFFDSKGAIATELFPAIGWEEMPPPHRKTPVQHLEDIGFFAAPLSVIGGYQLSASDFPRLGRGLARVIYCPSANARFKFGQFPLKQLQKHGIPVALGTEVLSSPEGFDLWEEMRLALGYGSQPLPTALELLKMATRQGAFCLGFENGAGALEAGKKADYLVVELPTKTSDPETLCRELILHTTPSSIRRVAIGGQIVKGN